jgi:hypothetical protein
MDATKSHCARPCPPAHLQTEQTSNFCNKTEATKFDTKRISNEDHGMLLDDINQCSILEYCKDSSDEEAKESDCLEDFSNLD